MSDSQTVPSANPNLESEDFESLRSLFRSILGSVPDAMIVSDEHGEIIAFSRAAEKMFGYRAEDMSGKNIRMLMTSKDEHYHDTYMRNYLKTGERQIIGIGRIVQAKLANGDTIPIELKIGETDLDGRRLFTGYMRDISEQQANAHRMASLQAELGNFSRLSAVGTMAAAMAHELNQPLTAVTNYLEAARDMLESADAETIAIVQEALDTAAQQSIRAGQIVRRLRDYVSRGELELRPVSLAELVSDAASLAKIGMDGPLARIIERVPPDLPDVLADRLQLRQVLVNLIKNAMEALPSTETPMIWITVRQASPEHVVVRIEDNGPGLTEAQRETLFDPFRSSKPGGMGLGLSICQTIVEAHGGTIEIASKSGEGAAFEFSLAVAPGDAQT